MGEGVPHARKTEGARSRMISVGREIASQKRSGSKMLDIKLLKKKKPKNTGRRSEIRTLREGFQIG